MACAPLPPTPHPSPPSSSQAREELRPVREDFEAKNKQLLDEMPKFYQSRIDYFQPSFEALIRAQVSNSPDDTHMHTHHPQCVVRLPDHWLNSG